MATAMAEPEVAEETLADLLERIGNVPLSRIPAKPAPGMATEEDVVAALDAANKRLFELVDGVLVEKTTGTKEGLWASLIGHFLWVFLDSHDLGLVIDAASPVRLRIGLVRIPDVSFISWERLPDDELPDEALASIVPNLAAEAISEGNTDQEMELKLKDYFRAGVKLVWFVYPKTQTAKVYTSPTKVKLIAKDGALTGRKMLPGFTLPLRELFARGKRRHRSR
jgi:Uma2 family endonuclease